MAKIFIDSNILVYALDKYHKKKQLLARQTLKSIVENNNAVISTQVLQEFYTVCTRKLQLAPLRVKEYVHNYSENLEVVQNSPELIERGIDISIISQISFWDALLIASAEYAKCSELITEDLNAGQIINGLKIRNPFAA
ncbi:MAG: PIN domain-containing protein [Candidatus Margulisbacteria bacterium]|nr:PIN domain-containing protein [Candidatus Margulisiibacteriota bacterium]